LFDLFLFLIYLIFLQYGGGTLLLKRCRQVSWYLELIILLIC